MKPAAPLTLSLSKGLDPAIVTIIAALARSAARRDARPQRTEPSSNS